MQPLGPPENGRNLVLSSFALFFLLILSKSNVPGSSWTLWLTFTTERGRTHRSPFLNLKPSIIAFLENYLKELM